MNRPSIVHFLVFWYTLVPTLGHGQASTLDSIEDPASLSKVNEATKKIVYLNRSGQFAEALEWIAQADTMKPNNLATYWTHSGNTFFGLGNYLEAIVRYKTALQPSQSYANLPQDFCDLNYRHTLLNLGTAYNRLGLTDSALSYYLRTPVVEENQGLLSNNIASLLINEQRCTEALVYLEKIELGPNTRPLSLPLLVQSNLFNCYISLGRTEEAKQVSLTIDELLTIQSDTSSALTLVMHYLIAMDDKAGFMELTERFRSHLMANTKDSKMFGVALQLLDLGPHGEVLQDELWTHNKNILAQHIAQNSTSANRKGKSVVALLGEMRLLAVGLFSLGLILLSFFLGYFGYTPVLRRLSQRKRLLRTSRSASVFDRLTKDERLFYEELTKHEKTLFRMTLDGKTNNEIASTLRISKGYLYNLRSGLRKKFEQQFKGQTMDEWLKYKVVP